MDGSSHLGGAATTWLPPRSGLPPGRDQPPWSFWLLPVAVREEADLRLRGLLSIKLAEVKAFRTAVTKWRRTRMHQWSEGNTL